MTLPTPEMQPSLQLSNGDGQRCPLKLSGCFQRGRTRGLAQGLAYPADPIEDEAWNLYWGQVSKALLSPGVFKTEGEIFPGTQTSDLNGPTQICTMRGWPRVPTIKGPPTPSFLLAVVQHHLKGKGATYSTANNASASTMAFLGRLPVKN